MSYTSGVYNKMDEKEQWIRITDGCPNQCEYCLCPANFEYYGVPKIERNYVKIMDMNFFSNPNWTQAAKELPNILNGKKIYYEFICGVDYRFMDSSKVQFLRNFNFKHIRFAWDYSLNLQFKIKDCLNLFIKAGYKAKEIQIFMICDWKISFEECLMKLMLLKIWNVQVSDCWYNNAKPGEYQCNYWTLEQCKTFRALCALHNQSIIFNGIYPDLKRANRLLEKLKEGKLLNHSSQL